MLQNRFKAAGFYQKGYRVEKEVIDNLGECLRANIPVALVTVIDNGGSSRGQRGAMMAIWGESESCGSVGGGNLEFWAVGEANKCLAAGLSREVSFVPDPEDERGTSCGGTTRLFIRVFHTGSRLIIVGGGHVGLELYHLALHQGFSVAVMDDREDIIENGRFPEAERLLADDFGRVLADYPITRECFITIATRAHATDEQALEAVIESDAGYIGMLGSSSKIKEIYQHLLARGVAREKLDAVYAPMGLNIATVKPKEIALSILSEIFLVKNGGSAEHMRTVKNIRY